MWKELWIMWITFFTLYTRCNAFKQRIYAIVVHKFIHKVWVTYPNFVDNLPCNSQQNHDVGLQNGAVNRDFQIVIGRKMVLKWFEMKQRENRKSRYFLGILAKKSLTKRGRFNIISKVL